MQKLSLVQSSPGPLTAADIARLVESRILSGEYTAGAQLPTVRELAQELGVNKNTVVRAYQSLERDGYLDVTQGRGAFVRPRDGAVAGVLSARWQAQVDSLVREAQTRGVTRAVVGQELGRSVERVYGRSRLRVAFVEDNTQDTDEMGAQLSVMVGHALEGVLLARVLEEPEQVAADFDLVTTTFYHLAEVSRAMKGTPREKVIGVNAQPSHESLLRIARLEVMMIGLVCEFETTIHNLLHTVHTYHPSATLLPTLVEDRGRLRSVMDKADALVVTRACLERVLALQPTMPVISIYYTIDQQSVDYLRQWIHEHKDAIRDS
ncbi:MAG: GntR family transcriptional regulator [Anaerolineae bacterium]|nr:GntR family transcriptional regulator [Anaerolineae bacterium]